MQKLFYAAAFTAVVMTARALDNDYPYITGGNVVAGVLVDPKGPSVDEEGAYNSRYQRTLRTMDTSKPWAEGTGHARSRNDQNSTASVFCCRLVCPAIIAFKPAE